MNILKAVSPRLKSSEQSLARVASYFALGGLALFALSLFHPKPLTVIFSMSIGHVLGMIAVLLYLVAILLDTHKSSHASAQGRAESPDIQADENPSTDGPPESAR